MSERFTRRDSSLRVIRETFQQQIVPGIAQFHAVFCENGLKIVTGWWDIGVLLTGKISQIREILRAAWPHNFIGIPESFENPVHLINFSFTRQQRSPQQQFRQNASNTPHINRRIINFRPEQQFRCPVPQRHYNWGELFGTWTESTRQAEIGNLDNAAVAQKEVAGFEVAVDDPVAVEVSDC